MSLSIQATTETLTNALREACAIGTFDNNVYESALGSVLDFNDQEVAKLSSQLEQIEEELGIFGQFSTFDLNRECLVDTLTYTAQALCDSFNPAAMAEYAIY